MFRKNERGALVVEASIVFPVMFLVIFFMIYTGNVYLQKCRVESIVTQYAIDGAAYCADPLLSNIESSMAKDGKASIPAAKSHEVYPYRFFSDTGAGNVESTIKTGLVSKVKKVSSGLFAGMNPILAEKDVKTDYKASFLYATFAVDVAYKVKMPIRLLGMDENVYMHANVHVEMPVSDTADMIRTMDMVWDYMERTGAAEKIEELGKAVSEWIKK